MQRRLDAAVDVVGLGAIDQRAFENRGGLAGRRVPIGEPPAYIRLGGPPIQRGFQRLGVGIEDVEGARVAPRGALALGAVALDHEAAVLLPVLLVAVGKAELHLPEVGGVLGIGVGPLDLRFCLRPLDISHRRGFPIFGLNGDDAATCMHQIWRAPGAPRHKIKTGEWRGGGSQPKYQASSGLKNTAKTTAHKASQAAISR